MNSAQTDPLATAPCQRLAGVAEHPLRLQLVNELHARPYEHLQPPVRASHLLLLSGEQAADAERGRVGELCQRFGAAPPAADHAHHSVDLGGLFRLKWERHTEFSVYSFLHQGRFDHPFREPVMDRVPADWLSSLPGELLVATHLAIQPAAGEDHQAPPLSDWFAANTVTGARVAGGKAVAWTDHRIHADGFGRVLIEDQGLNRRAAGRLLQRLMEIADYRAMALLTLPLARRIGRELTAIEAQLAEFTGKLNHAHGVDDERRLLAELSQLAAQGEQLAAAHSYRFSASRAYYALVQRRVVELREERIEGIQTFQEFQQRRLDPAMDTCETVAARMQSVAERVNRASDLLRTRVDIALEGQNRDLLSSMDRRARLQLRLQETVEGLSVVVLSYYLVGLFGYALKAGNELGLNWNTTLLTGLSVPLVVALVYFALRSLRNRLDRD